MLIAADLGPDVAERVIDEFRRSRFGREVTDEEVEADARRGDREDPGAGRACRSRSTAR